jgi:prepilin peptidase dependent protein B
MLSSGLHGKHILGRGFSIVELLVGVAVGLFVVGGATKLVIDNISNNRALLIETRLNQDLRAAADIVIRDLRRGGYWSAASALTGVTWPAASNPYRTITLSVANGASQVAYSYNGTGFTGYQVSTSSALQARTGGNWQDLTDANAMRVLAFDITPTVQQISLGANCTPACALGSPGCPVINVRRYDILLRGQAMANGAPVASVVRELRESVRVRNDEVPNPTCP